MSADVEAAQRALGCDVHTIRPDSAAHPVRWCAEHGVPVGPDQPCPVAARVTLAVLAAVTEPGDSR